MGRAMGPGSSPKADAMGLRVQNLNLNVRFKVLKFLCFITYM